MSSIRKTKLKLYKENPYCHWCGCLTTLTNIKHIKGQPNPTMATVDHVLSKFDVRRWVEHKPGEIRKVLACFKCNNQRSADEQARLGKEERLFRSKTGFTFHMVDGKNIFQKPLKTLDQVLDKLRKYGKLTPEYEKRQSECSTMAEQQRLPELYAPGPH